VTLPFDWLIGGPPESSGGSPGGNPYNPTFQSGDVQYAGPNDTFAGSADFEFGENVPNPGGVNGPFLLLGSGYGPGGTGNPRVFWIGTDEAFDLNTPGNFLGITAGEVQPGSSQPGGELFLVAGAADTGRGGLLQLQGGTSADGPGGDTVLQGGNSTGGIPGDVFVTGGQNGTQGANVHLIATMVNGISGVVRIRVNSTPLIDFFANGAIYLYSGGGFGTAGQHITSQGPGLPVIWA
jgi:hypothetical protein